MVAAQEATLIAPGIYRWSAYSPEHRVELTSHSVYHAGVMLVFDPIPVSPEVLDWFPTPVAPSAIVLTNGNHPRSAREWQERFACPVWGPRGATVDTVAVRPLDRDKWPWSDWQIHPLTGGGPGETAFYLPPRKLAVFGDAVVNLPGRPLELLPDKYCTSARTLRESLAQLIDRAEIETALFAHGNPILQSAGELIQCLLR